MANEAVLRTRKADHHPAFTVADGTGIEKGSLLKMTDPRTAALADGADDIIAGIAAREKIASDGRTRLAVMREGIFDMVLSGTCTVGDALVSHGNANIVKTAAVNAENIIGTALETGSEGETIQVELNPRGINLA